jgi:hypothetical protein
MTTRCLRGFAPDGAKKVQGMDLFGLGSLRYHVGRFGHHARVQDLAD